MHDPSHKFEGELSPGTEKLAKALSLIGQPPFLSIIPFVAICIHYDEDPTMGIVHSLICIFAAVILPLANIMYFSRRYKNDDKLDVVNKEDRMLPLIAGVVGYLIGLVLLYFTEAPLLATVLMLCYVAVTFAILLITPYWKISVHACGCVGPSMGLALAFWPFGALYILVLPPIAWSRYVLKKHTPLQLVMGAAVGFVISFIIMWFLIGF